MILPTKGIAPERALISIGALILSDLASPKTVSRLWSELRTREGAAEGLQFDWFVLALDLLYVMGALDYRRGQLVRVERDHLV